MSGSEARKQVQFLLIQKNSPKNDHWAYGTVNKEVYSRECSIVECSISPNNLLVQIFLWIVKKIKF